MGADACSRGMPQRATAQRRSHCCGYRLAGRGDRRHALARHRRCRAAAAAHLTALQTCAHYRRRHQMVAEAAVALLCAGVSASALRWRSCCLPAELPNKAAAASGIGSCTGGMCAATAAAPRTAVALEGLSTVTVLLQLDAQVLAAAAHTQAHVL